MRRDGQETGAGGRTDGAARLDGVRRARGFVGRAIGWMGRRRPPAAGLWIEPCGSIHTCFMRFPIDAAFLAADGRVLRVCRGLRPWRFVVGPRGARAVLETAAGRMPEAASAAGRRVAPPGAPE